MAEVHWRVTAGREFQEVANRLREIDATLPTRFRREIRNAVKPYVQRTKANARALPTPANAGTTGLRRRVARGVSVQAKVGRRPGLRVVTRMANPDEAMIPRGLDSGVKGWRHPVYGNREVWVRQPGFSWFRETLAESRPEIQHALTEVLEDARDFIARAG